MSFSSGTLQKAQTNSIVERVKNVCILVWRMFQGQVFEIVHRDVFDR